MRLVIAQMKHETNTFSPVPTTLARFARARATPWEGEAIRDAFRNTGSAIGAFIDLATKAGADMVLPVAGNAAPSGPVQTEAYEWMTSRILAAVAEGCDGVLLDLHGAMVTEQHDDGEGELLRRIRKIAPKVPIGVALDMHTNFFPAIGELSTAVAGYQTYPHVDMYDTGRRAAQPVLDLLAGKVKPTQAFAMRPMLPHVMRQSSLDEPNLSIQRRAQDMEKRGEALAATFFVGFPHADIPWAGSSAVVVTDNDPAKAKRLADELLDMAWKDRAKFIYEIEPLEASLARAQAMKGGPIVLLDHYDNCASGGTMDTMTVLEGILKAGLSDVCAFAIWDPRAVEQMTQAGVGANVTLSLGGKTAMPSLGLEGKPLEVSGKVKKIIDGTYINEGPMGRGELADMGPSAVLDTGKVEICILSRHVEPYDIASFKALGIDATKKRYLMLKSRVHWRAGLGPIAKAWVECAGTGVCTSDYSQLKFSRVRRPIYPLDLDATP